MQKLPYGQVIPVGLMQRLNKYRSVFKCWWPLAGSWLLMAFEMPIAIFSLSYMPEAERNIAALGGVAMPIAFIIESPILMLLSASTALSRDLASYHKLRIFMHSLGSSLALIHLIIAFTPFYYIVARDILAVPEILIEPTRMSLMCMLPWNWAIAHRRFNQGVLIRFGNSKAVGTGTAIRLVSLAGVMAFGVFWAILPGSAVGGIALSTGVLAEAAFVRWRVSPVLQKKIPFSAPGTPLTTSYLLHFYVPLALTAVMGMLLQPIGSATLSRMPQAIESLTVWPVLGTLVFIFRSTCIALTEVTVARLGDPEDAEVLFPFCILLGVASSGLLLLTAITPLSWLWFHWGASLPDDLVRYGRLTLFLAVPIPLLTVLQSWYQGNLLHAHRTRPITQAIAIFLVISAILLIPGIHFLAIPGLYYFHLVLFIGASSQTAWLWRAKNKHGEMETVEEVSLVESEFQ